MKLMDEELMKVFEEANWSDKHIGTVGINEESVVLTDPDLARRKIKTMKEDTKKFHRSLSIGEYDGKTQIVINSILSGEDAFDIDFLFK